MDKYVGSEFILTSITKGLTIKCNENGHGCGEFFEWDEIKHLLSNTKKTAHNSDYEKCANYLIGMFDWLQETVTEQDIVEVLKKHFA